VYALPAAGGEARALTAQKFGIDAFHWSPDGGSIAYLAKDERAPDSGHGPQVADLESNLARLWLIDVSSGASRMLGKNGYRIDDFQWQTPARLLVSATDTPRVEEDTDRIFSVTTAGAWAIAQRPPQPFNGLLVAPDGAQFAVRSTGAKGPIARDIFVGPVNGDSLRNISAPTGLAVAEVKWHEPDTVWLRVVDGFYNRIFRASRGKPPARIDLALSVSSFDVAHNGVLAFVGEDYAHLPEIYLRGMDRSVRQLTHLQQGWDGVRLAPRRAAAPRVAVVVIRNWQLRPRHWRGLHRQWSARQMRPALRARDPLARRAGSRGEAPSRYIVSPLDRLQEYAAAMPPPGRWNPESR
jgi:hypothetical protein